MATTSNSYAEKVFAEHPIALWSLDEQIDYASLINEDDRNMRNSWVFKNASDVTLTPSTVANSYATTDTWLPAFPASIFESYANQLIIPPTGDQLKATSPVLFQQSDIDDSKTFAIATYVFTFNRSVSINVGFEYLDATATTVRVTRQVDLLSISEWQFVSESYEFPDVFSDFKLVFEVIYNSAPTGYYVLLHGISTGQWSENFNVESLGVNVSTLPSTLAVSGSGVGAKTYGLQDVRGYYMANGSILCASNAGMPMVYGAENSTRITPNVNGEPSLILPGYGFMNDEGQYSDITLEMWLRIQSSAIEPKRIFGPVGSTDGLYVNDAFVILKIGKYNSSYYVGEWDRPMLVAIRLSSTVASLIINGEEVITLELDPTQINFPSKLNELSKDQNWLGFYAYDDVPAIEIDCVGIYSYAVPSIVEKRRWIYGQGVETSENTPGSNLGTTVSMDYAFSNYAKNYLYPDIGKWKQGVIENLIVDGSTISLPQYQLPTLHFDNKTTDQWYTDNAGISGVFGTYMSLRPNSGWSTTNGYMLYSNLNLIQQDLKAFYGLFESDAANASKQILFLLENESTAESLEITIQGSTVAYTFYYQTLSGSETIINSEVLYTDSLHTPGDFLFTGMDISKFANNFGGRVARFLGTKQQLKLYIGGNKDLTKTFSGNIYRIGFCTARNLEKISVLFADTGLSVGYNALDASQVYDAGNNYFLNDPQHDHWELYLDGGEDYFGNLNTAFEDVIDGGGVYSLIVSTILDHVASYTLIPKIYMENFILDIAVNSYWQDYVPMSYFSKYVKSGIYNSDGSINTYQDLDFIQFNIDYPQINKFLAQSFDTTNSIVRTFVSFQNLKDDAAVSTKRFTKTLLTPKNGVVTPGSDWQIINADGSVDYIKYEVVNDTIIYPPPATDTIGFKNLGLVLHIEIISNGITENPVKIRSLQLASQALDGADENPVGTKFGTNVYPYKKSSEFYDYKTRNPYSLYKGSTPYFYLTATSGMRLKGFYDGDIERGISIPVNRNTSSFFKVAAWQLAIRYEDDVFPERVTELFEIYAKSSKLEALGEDYIRHIKFYVVPDNALRHRGRIYAIDADTGLQQSDILFHINGKSVMNPMIDTRTWSVLSISFESPVDFSGYEGSFNVTGPITFDNVSYYQSSEAEEASRSVYRKWADVKITDNLDKDWAYWKGLESGTYTWRNILIISSEGFRGIDTKSIYKKYTGTDRIIIDTSSQFRLNNYRYTTYKDITWQSKIVTST